MANQVLIVSPDVSFRARLTLLLEEAGLRVEALDAPVAFSAGPDLPGLVLFDVHPTHPEPSEFGQQLRASGRQPWLPIIYLVPEPSDVAKLAARLQSNTEVILPRSLEPICLISTAKALIRTSTESAALQDLELDNQRLIENRNELKVINDRTTSLLESITDGFYSLDRDWKFTYLNAAAERISGRSRDELLGRSIWEVFPESVNTPAYDYYHQAVSHGISISFEIFYEPLEVWLDINIYPSPEGLSAYYREITERKRAEAVLSQCAEQQTAIALVGERALAGAGLPDLLDEAARCVAHTLDVRFAGVFELQAESGELLLVAGTGWKEGAVGHTIVPSEGNSQFGCILRQQAPVNTDRLPAETRFEVAASIEANGVICDLAVVIRGQDSIYGVLSAHSTESRQFTAQEINFVQSVANILAAAIQRRRLEENLLHSQTTLARAQEIAGIGTWSVNSTNGTFYWSEEMYRIFGVHPERFTPNLRSIVARVHPEDRPRTLAFFQATKAGTVDGHLDHRIVLDGGEIRWLRLQAERREERGTRRLHLVGTVLDISERKRAEAALRESQERYQVLFDRSPIPKMLYDEESLRFLAVNDAAVEYYGYSREAFLEMRLVDLWSPEAAQELSSIREWPAQVSTQVTHLKRDGSPNQVEIFVQQVLLRGRPARILMAQDVSERAQLEAQLRQAQKMEAVGRLAGGVAHDFNNMLAVISGYSELLLHLTDSEDRSDLRGPLQEIQKASQRAARLTRQLLAFSRKQVLTPKVLDLGTLVLDFERMLSRLIGEDIEVAVRIAPNLHQIKADPGQLEQVLLNLVVNSRDAMPTGGKITIEVQNAELGADYRKKHRLIEPGEYVLLAVSDTGCGMDKETLEHAFEPFFTTKDAEHGTGLGLATVFGIIQQSEGHFDVYSEVGIGTTFKVYLPRTPATVEPVELPLSTGSISSTVTGDAMVLLVEDEEMVRALVQEVLTMYGYKVLAAANGHEALQVAEQLAPHIDLLLTDVVMPGGMGGRQLAEELRRHRPDLKVLYMSGYTDDAVVRHGIIEADTAFIQKPFTPLALARKVREVLALTPDGSHGHDAA